MSDPIRSMAEASLFPLEGALIVPGLGAPVTVERDPWGIPRITADSPDDLWFAQGLVTAGERLFQLELLLRAATGRLSEIFGELTYDDDVFVRTIGLHRAGERHAAEDWQAEDHGMHERFRAGLRAWLELMPAKPVEYQLLDLTPDLPDGAAPYAAAFAYLAWNLSNNWEVELLRAELDERVGRALTDILLPAAAAGGGVGSNNWVIAGRRTASGAPLLANDPHLRVTQPGIWLELHLRAPGYDARGVALPFSPGIILGATPHHAWGATNVGGDVQDLFEERPSDDGTATLYRDQWEPLTIHDEAIVVRGEPEPRVVRVRESRHGPLLTHGVAGELQTRYRDLPRTYALRWTGADATLRPSIAVAVATAADADGFERAIDAIVAPGQNFVYADVDGTISYRCTGRHPIRARGDGTRPVPGWDGEHEWTDWIPTDELPHERDPDRGWTATANNDVQPPGYKHLISKDFHAPSRFERIAALLDAQENHRVGDSVAMQSDTASSVAGSVLACLLTVEPDGERQRDAIERLRAWDHDLAAASHEAALYEAWLGALGRRLLAERLGDDLFTAYLHFHETFQAHALAALVADGTADRSALLGALDDAIDDVGDRTWGELHALALAHPLARIPGLDAVFTAATIPLGGDEHTVSQGAFDALLGYRPAVIPSVRFVWDLGDLERSVGVVPAGVSGNPASPHWSDQSTLFAEGAVRPAGFATESVSALTLVPS